MRSTVAARPVPVPEATAVPRLLSGLGADASPVGIDEHLARWGPAPVQSAAGDLVDQLSASGVAGHGGAWFPVATKWRSIPQGRFSRPVVVANGAEGEPASSKDAFILTRLPHLVLDGLSLAGAALGASQAVVYVPERLVAGVEAAVNSRRPLRLDPVEIRVIAAPDRFIAGQESSVVNVVNGRRDAVPSFIAIQPVRERGVNNRPTLVQNVETLAHVALIARFGPTWYRGLGTEESPGTMLLTVTGRWSAPRVMEAALGTRFREILDLSPGDAGNYLGALLGGYGGGWVTMSALMDLRLTEDAARRAQSSLGAGVIALLPNSVCPLTETARVVRYMEEQAAGQCGPCIHGLAGLTEMTKALAVRPTALVGGTQAILEVCDLIDGRGACRHPDGVTRFVRTALVVFKDHVASHLGGQPCSVAHAPGVLPCPRPAVRAGGEAGRW
jgi:NADH:ubiquinone oxidoreductase subunit F (NADH-binding)